ncbi:MAG: 3-deoxy-7-phosphoheptulonate synthase, partial [Gammaproteobacteria bacterium]|nr:3-deoxy-7-phosphoheptulonate synthase [Gammaproteobacteria bacterium]
MIIVMNSGATEQDIEGVVNKIKEAGLDANISRGTERTVIGAIGDERKLDQELIDA